MGAFLTVRKQKKSLVFKLQHQIYSIQKALSKIGRDTFFRIHLKSLKNNCLLIFDEKWKLEGQFT